MSESNCKNGFTLVELSIVLVIIGLIIGGVLVGQDMIRSAEGRSIISQIEKYNSAVSTFRGKYAALPGDITNPTTYISGSAVGGGDGNGYVYSASGLPSATPAAITSEIAPFWNHLSLSGLIDGNMSGEVTATVIGDNFPFLKSGRGGMLAYAATDGNHYWHLGLANSADDTIVTAVSMRPEEAFYIDSKMDDGKPGSGIVVAKGGVVLEGAASAGIAGSSNCVNSTPTPNIYNLTTISPLCMLRVKMN